MTVSSLHKKEFYKTLLLIGAPIALQHLIASSLNLVDTLMIGKLGEDAIAAVGIANRLFFLFSLFIYGAYSGGGVFTAQYWGKRDKENIHRILGIMMVFGVAFGVLFTLAATIVPRQILQLFSRDAAVLDLGVQYLRIVAISYVMTAISFAYAFSCRSVHKTTLPMVVSAIAISTNTVLNYILIYGKFGMSALGVEGAAIATTIARLLEMLLLLIFIYRDKEHPLVGPIRSYFDIHKDMVVNVVRTATPVFVNEATWALGNVVYFIAFGFLGTGAVAVVQIGYTVSDLFQALFMGLGSACSVMVGNAVGNDEKEKAVMYSVTFIKITVVLSVFIALMLYWSRPLILLMYSELGAETQKMLMASLAVIAFYQIPKMYTYTMIVGILRGGGDTTYCMFLDLLSVWLVGVPLGFISVLWWQWPVHMVIAAVYFEEFIKVFVTLPRFFSRKWIHNVIEFSYQEN
ncbi:MAG: MATE family efflux transporter [Clostridia bacterium]|nr:MATE family efflux transporter [Clostridia bacterium]